MDAADERRRRRSGRPPAQQLLVQTISQLTGLQIDHFASVDLLGFFNLSNVVGGVEVNLCAAGPRPLLRRGLPGRRADHQRRRRAEVRPPAARPAARRLRPRSSASRSSSPGVVRKMLSDNVLLDLGKQQQLVQAVAESLTVDQSLDLVQLAQQMQAVHRRRDHSSRRCRSSATTRTPRALDILRLPDSTRRLHEFFAKLSADPAPAPAHRRRTHAGGAEDGGAHPTVTRAGLQRLRAAPGWRRRPRPALQRAGFVVAGTGQRRRVELHERPRSATPRATRRWPPPWPRTIPGATHHAVRRRHAGHGAAGASARTSPRWASRCRRRPRRAAAAAGEDPAHRRRHQLHQLTRRTARPPARTGPRSWHCRRA